MWMESDLARARLRFVKILKGSHADDERGSEQFFGQVGSLGEGQGSHAVHFKNAVARAFETYRKAPVKKLK